MASINQVIDRFIDENMERYLAETMELCALPSVSATGEGIKACADKVEEILARHGLEVQRFETPGNPIFVGKAAGESERTLLFYNHYDVQPPEPLELWTTPPYEPAIRDGKLFARGSSDDKGEFISRLMAIDAVREAHGGDLPCGVVVVIEGQEEVGSPHIAQFVQEHLELLASHAAVWEEGGVGREGPTTLLGKRGVLDVELFVETIRRDAHSGGANLLPSAAWRLVWALASLKDSCERILIPGFYDDLKEPTALDREMYEIYPNLLQEQQAMLDQYGIKEFLGGKRGVEAELMVFEPTCNIQGITTGYQGKGGKTVIPARASAKLDFRLLLDQDPDDIEAKLRAHLDAQGFSDVKIERGGAMWPAKVPADDPFVRLSAETAEEVYGMPYHILPTTGGSSPVYAFAKPLGNIPVVTAGVGYWDKASHAPDEHIRIEDFRNGTRHVARILAGFDKI
ncbi:MAG: M20/M25/M40 family metallo-hydrolase [Anaerolineae bacterium]|nr:M20/M25/M40 family metallo-hydrolase [Anaerolineae bacterium]